MSFNTNSPQNEKRQSGSGNSGNPWSLLVAVVSGIPIRLHFTFILLIIYLAATGVQHGGAGNVLLVLGLFFCVVLHELGHSLTAQRLGYTVQDIVLYPIGGVAAIEDMPRARHELLIALAGPAVNVVIASVLALYLQLTTSGGLTVHLTALQQSGGVRGNPVALLLMANISLALFNMLPAFPMDGGRVLRALLALRIPRHRATRIAALLGQVVAVGMGIFGYFILHQFGLVLIALFVFFGAAQEAQADDTREVTTDALVGEAMVREFQTLTVGDTLKRAIELLLSTSQQDFPIVLGSEVHGVLSRSALLRGLAQDGETAYVSVIMEREVVFATADEPLESYMVRADGVQRAPVLVRDTAGKLIGMLTMENLMEFLTVRQVLRSRSETA